MELKYRKRELVAVVLVGFVAGCSQSTARRLDESRPDADVTADADVSSDGDVTADAETDSDAEVDEGPVNVGIATYSTSVDDFLTSEDGIGVTLVLEEVREAGGLLGGRELELVVQERDHENHGSTELLENPSIDAVAVIKGRARIAPFFWAENQVQQRPLIVAASRVEDLFDDDYNRDENAFSFHIERHPWSDGFVMAALVTGELGIPEVEGDCPEIAGPALAVFQADTDERLLLGAGIRSNPVASGLSMFEQVFTGDLWHEQSVLGAIRVVEGATECVVSGLTADAYAHFLTEWETIDFTYAREITWYATGDPLDTSIRDVLIRHNPELTVLQRLSPDMSPAALAMLETLVELTGEDEPSTAVSAYDALAILVLAIEAAGSTDNVAIRDAIRRVSGPDDGDVVVEPGQIGMGLAALARGEGVDYEGISGHLDLTAAGGPAMEYDVYRWNGASFDRIHHLDRVAVRRLYEGL